MYEDVKIINFHFFFLHYESSPVHADCQERVPPKSLLLPPSQRDAINFTFKLSNSKNGFYEYEMFKLLSRLPAIMLGCCKLPLQTFKKEKKCKKGMAFAYL